MQDTVNITCWDCGVTYDQQVNYKNLLSNIPDKCGNCGKNDIEVNFRVKMYILANKGA